MKKSWRLSPLLLVVLALVVPHAPGQATEPVQAGEIEIIEVGRENWGNPWLPDFRAGSGTIPIPVDRRIDVLMLGDGYLPNERDRYVRDLNAWYEKFVSLTPYKEMRGAFRVRGVWTPSETRSTGDRRSYYRLSGTNANQETARRIHDVIRRSNSNLQTRGNTLSNTYVAMRILGGNNREPSGVARATRDPDSNRSVRVGYAAYTHHEFGHAYGNIRDEYIRGEGSRATGNTPYPTNIYNVSNLSYTTDPERVPWRHLFPGTPANPDPESVIGVLWIGGTRELGAWHSEGMCMMNGTHQNYAFDRSRRGVTLRDRDNYCFWCEEIIVARTWKRTGLLGDSTDGVELWRTWETDVRPLYHAFMNVPQRIAERNARNRERGWHEAQIFVRPGQGGG